MIPTVAQVYSRARGVLAEDEVTAGEVFTDAYLYPRLQTANNDLFRAYQTYGTLTAQKSLYYVLPANTAHFRPSQAGVVNFGEPIYGGVFQRRVTGLFTITNVVPNPGAGLCRVTTSAPHGLATGNDVIIYGVGGVSDDVNDEWIVTLVDATNFDLNGCFSTGTYTSGGFASTSPDEWGLMQQTQNEISLAQASSGNAQQVYNWKNETFRLYPSTEQRQLKIGHTISGNIPENRLTFSLGVDDSLDFLAYRTAALAAYDKGADQAGQRADLMAIGPDGRADGSGGFLEALITEAVKTLGQTPIVFAGYRPRFNTGRRRGRIIA
jgi:hypothetical protein